MNSHNITHFEEKISVFGGHFINVDFKDSWKWLEWQLGSKTSTSNGYNYMHKQLIFLSGYIRKNKVHTKIFPLEG
jgi:hypothetical protein